MIKWLFIIPIALIILIGGLSWYLQPNDYIGCGDKPSVSGTRCLKADTIVVVSGGDTVARTNEGVKLFQNGWANSIVFSGAAQDKSGPSNAAAMRLQAINAGVPVSAIYVEEEGSTTEQNAVNTKTIFENNNFNTAILVTSGYHQRRADLEFKKESPNVMILNHPLLVDKDWSFWWWITPRGWWLAGGEIVKITAFYIGASS